MEGSFRHWRVPRAPLGQKSPWRVFREGFFVVGGRLRAPSNYIFPVKHSRLEGAERKGRLRRPTGDHGPVAPLPTPLAITLLDQKQFDDWTSSLLGTELSLIKVKVKVDENLQKEQQTLSEKFNPALSQAAHQSTHWMPLNLTWPPLIFIYGGFPKDQIYRNSPKNLEDMKVAIT